MKETYLSVPEFLLVMTGLGIELQTRGEKLVIRGSREALSPELLGVLEERRAELIPAIRDLEHGAVIFTVQRPNGRSLPTTAIMHEDEAW